MGAFTEPEIRVRVEEPMEKTVHPGGSIHNSAEGRDIVLRMLEGGECRCDVVMNGFGLNVCSDHGFAGRTKSAGVNCAHVAILAGSTIGLAAASRTRISAAHEASLRRRETWDAG